jgi:starch synthase (maltosyl-transferring)
MKSNFFAAYKAPPSRVVIDKISPQIDGGRFAAKRYIDEEIEVKAVLLLDGHDLVKGRLLYRHENEKEYRTVALKTSSQDIGNDLWRARFQPTALGRYYVTVEAGIDRLGTWFSGLQKKQADGQDVTLDLMAGVDLFEKYDREFPPASQWRAREVLGDLKSIVTKAEGAPELKKFLASSQWLEDFEAFYDEKSRVRYETEVPIQVEPVVARFSAWYEFFPRSTVDGSHRHGTLRDAAHRLDYIRDLGFDVVYLPPIHPIGEVQRKGKNNSLKALATDVGSPWAIGAEDGGHRSIHSALGTLADFEFFVDKARRHGMHVAMDVAFQCSPDHPYLKDHLEWFKKRPDGSIQYAENPPKKYQDIYPFDFESREWVSLWEELKDVMLFWVEKGVKIFRVDNPHTKAFHFWEWAIAEIKRDNPEVVFLAEAFTRPQVMAYLAKIGFSQSYTYFTWRSSQWELTQYLTELTQTELAEYFVPNFWPNTPDILPGHLQHPDPGIYGARFILAATLASNYGIYGPAFELLECQPLAANKEEYLHSEKYELKHWRLDAPQSIAPLIKKVNALPKICPSLQRHRNIRFHSVSNSSLLAYSKTHRNETLLILVNLDPSHPQAGEVELPLNDWGIDPSVGFEVKDLLSGEIYHWMGWRNYVEFRDPRKPAHIFEVKLPPGAESLRRENS